MDSAKVRTILIDLLHRFPAIAERIKVSKLGVYDSLQKRLHAIDVSSDRDYQRSFAGFYRIRGSGRFRALYFELLEHNKRKDELTFPSLLREIYDGCGVVHPSFASKLIATVNPDRVVYDDQVLQRLSISRFRNALPEKRITDAIVRYSLIERFHNIASSDEVFLTLTGRFDTSFPRFEHFSKTKKTRLTPLAGSRLQYEITRKGGWTCLEPKFGSRHAATPIVTIPKHASNGT